MIIQELSVPPRLQTIESAAPKSITNLSNEAFINQSLKKHLLKLDENKQLLFLKNIFFKCFDILSGDCLKIKQMMEQIGSQVVVSIAKEELKKKGDSVIEDVEKNLEKMFGITTPENKNTSTSIQVHDYPKNCIDTKLPIVPEIKKPEESKTHHTEEKSVMNKTHSSKFNMNTVQDTQNVICDLTESLNLNEAAENSSNAERIVCMIDLTNSDDDGCVSDKFSIPTNCLVLVDEEKTTNTINLLASPKRSSLDIKNKVSNCTPPKSKLLDNSEITKNKNCNIESSSMDIPKKTSKKDIDKSNLLSSSISNDKFQSFIYKNGKTATEILYRIKLIVYEHLCSSHYNDERIDNLVRFILRFKEQLIDVNMLQNNNKKLDNNPQLKTLQNMLVELLVMFDNIEDNIIILMLCLMRVFRKVFDKSVLSDVQEMYMHFTAFYNVIKMCDKHFYKYFWNKWLKTENFMYGCFIVDFILYDGTSIETMHTLVEWTKISAIQELFQYVYKLKHPKRKKKGVNTTSFPKTSNTAALAVQHSDSEGPVKKKCKLTSTRQSSLLLHTEIPMYSSNLTTADLNNTQAKKTPTKNKKKCSNIQSESANQLVTSFEPMDTCRMLCHAKAPYQPPTAHFPILNTSTNDQLSSQSWPTEQHQYSHQSLLYSSTKNMQESPSLPDSRTPNMPESNESGYSSCYKS